MSTVMKPVSLTNSSCLVSFFTSPSRLPSLLSLPSKPINLILSSSSYPSINLILSSSSYPSLKTNTHFSSLVAFVASDWAQQGEQNETTAAVDEEDQTVDAEPTLSASAEGEEEDSEPNEEAKLYVGNLPYDVDSQSLAMLFEKVGTVEIAEVIYNRETEQSRGFGFITMSTVEEAEKAADTFNGYDVNGRLLTVNKASPRGSRIERPPRVFEQALRVYVGNLPWEVDNAQLEQVFSEHGKVVDARVVFDRETGRSRGFGFVTMSTETEMNDAIAALDGQSLEGRTIRVNVAEQKPRRSSF